MTRSPPRVAEGSQRLGEIRGASEKDNMGLAASEVSVAGKMECETDTRGADFSSDSRDCVVSQEKRAQCLDPNLHAKWRSFVETPTWKSLECVV